LNFVKGLKTLQCPVRLVIILAGDLLTGKETQIIQPRLRSCDIRAAQKIIGNLQVESPENNGITVLRVLEQRQFAPGRTDGDQMFKNAIFRYSFVFQIGDFEAIRDTIEEMIQVIEEPNAEGHQLDKLLARRVIRNPVVKPAGKRIMRIIVFSVNVGKTSTSPLIAV
jgi:hypothetical protein